MGQRHCLTVERILAGSSEFPESEADLVSKDQTDWIQRRFLFAGAVVEARWPIEDRIGSHLAQSLAVGRG